MANPRSLEALGLDGDALTRPLGYPGAIPADSGLLVDGNYLAMHPAGRELGQWPVETPEGAQPLDEALAAAGAAPTAQRHPVLAVGSNAAPAQLKRKFGRRRVPAVLPLVRARAEGISAGVSAHVSPGRYVPAAPIVTPGEASELFVLWLDDRQLAALDKTEPNYRRAPLDKRFPVRLLSGPRVPDCAVYVGRWGCLLDRRGRPRRANGQRELLTDLLDESDELRRLFGATPEEFVEAARDEQLREKARRVFADEKLVRPQPELEQPLAHSR